jgi:hypothetical protein
MIIKDKPPPIYIISGGVGTSGEQLVNTVLAQFPDAHIRVMTCGNIRHTYQLEPILIEAKEKGGLIVHTLVDASLREYMIEQASCHNIFAIDSMGPLLDRLAEVLGIQPLGQPGLYRQFHRAYFERVAAIEYTLAHDDGMDPPGWPVAEIVLTGVSRTGKTPLSVYLSVLGWKVANIPLVPGVPPHGGLFELNHSRVIGLTIAPDRLLQHRRQRSARLGVKETGSYADPQEIMDELLEAERVFRKGGFHVLDVTDKTIEASADEILRMVS